MVNTLEQLKFDSRMENGEHGQSESREMIVAIYSDFMMRIAKFDELASTGSRFLVSFQQALGFLRRPPIDKTSKLLDPIINAHGSRRVLSYFEAGCANNHDSIQNVSKLHTCHRGLQDHINQAKIVIDELDCLLGNAASVMQTSNQKDEDTSCYLDSCITSSVQTAKANDEDISCNLDSCIASSDQERPDVADYASMMAIIYSMVKQDYIMQARIVSSLNLKSSQGEELETYCQMWSLRPFIDDEIMRKAWNLVPGC